MSIIDLKRGKNAIMNDAAILILCSFVEELDIVFDFLILRIRIVPKINRNILFNVNKILKISSMTYGIYKSKKHNGTVPFSDKIFCK
jgi:hypothetical protein